MRTDCCVGVMGVHVIWGLWLGIDFRRVPRLRCRSWRGVGYRLRCKLVIFGRRSGEEVFVVLEFGVRLGVRPIIAGDQFQAVIDHLLRCRCGVRVVLLLLLHGLVLSLGAGCNQLREVTNEVLPANQPTNQPTNQPANQPTQRSAAAATTRSWQQQQCSGCSAQRLTHTWGNQRTGRPSLARSPTNHRRPWPFFLSKDSSAS